ncbi:MAG TPA: ABC transporter permease subunit [Candidatus Acidoferrales bacterium]|nr:ABC transporter permease subunit [Candidatus Acidoferrales bacterium]
MRIFSVLLRRELAAYFFSFTGYVIIAAITFLTGECFVQFISALGSVPFPMPVTQMFFGSFYFWMILLLSAPVITMRLFAHEKASGTFETLMTTPVGDLEVVAAKFAAAFLFYLIMWLPLLACLFLVGHFTNQAGALDFGTVGGMYLGILLAGAFFLSFGCLASAVSRSQMVAAMISLAFGISQFAAAYWAKSVPLADTWQSQLWSCLNLFDQITDLSRGTVDTRAVIFYLSATFLFLFLTLRVVESRRWK